RDHIRSAALAAITTVVLAGGLAVATSFADRAPDDTRANAIAETYMFVGLLLGMMTVASTTYSLWKAAAWRIELPDTPEHRRGLADAIDHLLDGAGSPDERRDFLDVSYVQPQLEQVRRATLKLAKRHAGSVPEHFRAQIKRFTAGIRASAGPSDPHQDRPFTSHRGGPRE